MGTKYDTFLRFNPRSRTGSDGMRPPDQLTHERFQSTLPHGRFDPPILDIMLR